MRRRLLETPSEHSWLTTWTLLARISQRPAHPCLVATFTALDDTGHVSAVIDSVYLFFTLTALLNHAYRTYCTVDT